MAGLNATATFRSSYIYNNLMYGLASYVPERVAGDTWENLMTNHIFHPYGMTSSTFAHVTDLNADNVAKPHQRDADGSWKRVTPEMSR